ncbi:hypothetical protein MTsPCn9_04530 [Croceitalea sp. MTPC9]|uniref:hypothetical protein n=1 Tax=unclassified Croceitalea TaxID=2632280 RepID=UPI002B3BCAC9|nr:hypothetical protein MTsPCn6_04180 [Croceitalea sp. MTPC6]GMN15517.1 hypothetical protein MTsPCn9_04530 [Croceitalea sp. MTPC9]
MKKSLLLITLLILTACGGVKKTQEALNSGNYVTAMNKAIAKLSDNKTKKGNQEYVLLLEEAFVKNKKRELETVAFLEKDGNPANLEKIYRSYLQLKKLQNRIAPLLPLPIYGENRNASFNFKNYDSQIIQTKAELSEYLYANASDLLKNAVNKYDYRQAYDDFKYLNEINPGYYNTVSKMDEAYTKGLDYVRIELRNDTQQIIPERLEEELLDFNTYGINNLWTQFHKNPLESVKYDYAMYLDFREINISPEQTNEKQIIKEKQIRDGYDYVLDANGNVAKDSLGNDIKVDKFKKVTCSFYQFTQFKNAQVGAKVSFVDLENGQEINSYPISSEFVFEHVYANYSGDKRALENNLIALLDLAAVPFPSNEQMVYDAGEDLKARLKSVVQRHNFN